MDEFIHYLQAEMEVPGIFSWFHFVMLIPIITLAILIPYFFKDAKEKTYKRILLIFWIILIILEIFKQIIRAFHYGNPSYWEYSVRDFPFSICSMVYFFIPIILFIDNKKHPVIVDAANGYMCLICLWAGIIVCVYPNMVMSNLVFINVQSMIHHGSQIILGVYIYVWNRKCININTVYRSLVTFLATSLIAIIINIAFYPNYINMFFINPTIITNLPVGNIVQKYLGYPIYLLLFLSAVTLLALLTYLVETSLYKVISNKKKSA